MIVITLADNFDSVKGPKETNYSVNVPMNVHAMLKLKLPI